MKKLLISAFFVILLSTAAFSDSVYVLAGYNWPAGKSDVFTQNESETSFRVNDLNWWSGTFGYDHFLSNYISLGGSISGYERDTNVEDNDFEHADGTPIFRNIRLEIVPMELNLHFLPAGRDAGLIPYVGGGVGVYYWEYEEAGDFIIDRNSFHPTLITGRAYSDGVNPGWHIEGGLQIPVSSYATIMGEYRYFSAKGDLDTRSFDPAFEPLDLSSSMVSFGCAFWF